MAKGNIPVGLFYASYPSDCTYKLNSRATTVTLDSEIVQAIQQATKQKDKASAVHMALNEYLRLQKLRQLADLAGTVELRYSNDELEAM